VNADFGFCASALLAAKAVVADEAVATDSPALEEQGKRLVRDPSTSAGGQDEAVVLGNRCMGSGLEGVDRLHRPHHPPVLHATPVAGAIPANPLLGFPVPEEPESGLVPNCLPEGQLGSRKEAHSHLRFIRRGEAAGNRVTEPGVTSSSPTFAGRDATWCRV
jgi:hypothetical protein